MTGVQTCALPICPFPNYKSQLQITKDELTTTKQKLPDSVTKTTQPTTEIYELTETNVRRILAGGPKPPPTTLLSNCRKK